MCSVCFFEVISEYVLVGDQLQVIVEFVVCINVGEIDVVLFGVIGIGKFVIIVWFVEQVQCLIFVFVYNKIFVVQFVNEFCELMLNNVVEYFVLYYDYYQLEVYVFQMDIFIEKDLLINFEVEWLWYLIINLLFSCCDVVVVLIVFCIYGFGVLEEYFWVMVVLQVGECYDCDVLICQFIVMQYNCNDVDFLWGNFWVCGDIIEIIFVYEEYVICIEFFGDEIEVLYLLYLFMGEVIEKFDVVLIFFVFYYVVGIDVIQCFIGMIEYEFEEWLKEFECQGKLFEVQCLCMCMMFDFEMFQQFGFCLGIENYLWYMDGCMLGELLYMLFDFFLDDFLLVIDELYVIVLQIGVMYEGDVFCKCIFVDYGFWLLSVMDNWLLWWDEFKNCVGQIVYFLVMLGKYEMGIVDGVVEQIICLIGFVDLEIVVKLLKGQIDDFFEEIWVCVECDECVLVMIFIKKMVEEFMDFFGEYGVWVCYLYFDVDMFCCVELFSELCVGVYDVFVGINLLCEGFDLLEVLFVVIFDVDKEGFLCFGMLFIQMIGCVVCNVFGEVYMYVDKMMDLMVKVIEEIDCCCEKQVVYNKEYGIDLQLFCKCIVDIIEVLVCEGVDMVEMMLGWGCVMGKGKFLILNLCCMGIVVEGVQQFEVMIQDLFDQMLVVVVELKFEFVGCLCDEVQDFKKEFCVMEWVGYVQVGVDWMDVVGNEFVDWVRVFLSVDVVIEEWCMFGIRVFLDDGWIFVGVWFGGVFLVCVDDENGVVLFMQLGVLCVVMGVCMMSVGWLDVVLEVLGDDMVLMFWFDVVCELMGLVVVDLELE